MLPHYVTDLVYLLAAGCFIYGLHSQAHPRRAQRGSTVGALGMLLAVAITLLDRRIADYATIAAALALGGAIGVVVALRVPVTSLPQLVALRNAFGGAVSVLVAGAALLELAPRHASAAGAQFLAAGAAGDLIGGATLGGGLVAFARLQGILSDDPVRFPGVRVAQALLAAAALTLIGLQIAHPEQAPFFWLLFGASALFGVLAALPISGTDMPVVIALLTSLAGLAAAANGFMLNNTLLLISGALVGSSGIVLTRIMCRGMNRSLADVLLRSGVTAAGGPSADEVYAGKVKSATAEEIALLLDGACRVVIVPGYGMAVAQAQHVVCDLARELEKRGATVEYAIHPVAGRMPGQMNVLLAEADVPYEQMKEPEAINPIMAEVDVAIVIGANDIVNPLARTDPGSPIAGMEVIEVDRARTVVVVKRSLSPGFAGIPNPLFAGERTLMFFADGRQAILDLLAAIRAG
jgi:H+-translocating NAD(P) transhydrogenase subunit beta